VLVIGWGGAGVRRGGGLRLASWGYSEESCAEASVRDNDIRGQMPAGGRKMSYTFRSLLVDHINH